MRLRMRPGSLPGFGSPGTHPASGARLERAGGAAAGRQPRQAVVDDPAATTAYTKVCSMSVEHAPDRPSWDCQVCEKPWPCDPAREDLCSEMDRVTLAINMWLNLENAVLELPDTPADELFARFIAWTR